MTPEEMYNTLTTLIRCMLNEDGCAAAECDTCEYYLGDEFQMLPFMIQIRDLVKNMRWIPVTETLPPGDEYVLVTIENRKGHRYVRRAQYLQEHDEWADEREYFYGVVAWMKLPDPYDGGTE